MPRSVTGTRRMGRAETRAGAVRAGRRPLLRDMTQRAGAEHYLETLPAADHLFDTAPRALHGPFLFPRTKIYSRAALIPEEERGSARVCALHLETNFPFGRAALVDLRLLTPIHTLSEGRASELVAEKVALMRGRLRALQDQYPRDWATRGVHIMEAMTRGDKSGRSSRILVNRHYASEGAFYLLNGHRRVTALSLLAATGEIPLTWLRHIPVIYLENMSEESIAKLRTETPLDLGETLAEISVDGVTPATAYYTLRASFPLAAPLIGPADVRWDMDHTLTAEKLRRALVLRSEGLLTGTADLDQHLLGSFVRKRYNYLTANDDDLVQWIGAVAGAKALLFANLKPGSATEMLALAPAFLLYRSDAVAYVSSALTHGTEPIDLLSYHVTIEQFEAWELLPLFRRFYLHPEKNVRDDAVRHNFAELSHHEHVAHSIAALRQHPSGTGWAGLRQYLAGIIRAMNQWKNWSRAAPDFFFECADDAAIEALARDLSARWGTSAAWRALAAALFADGDSTTTVDADASKKMVGFQCIDIADALAWWEAVEVESRIATAQRMRWIKTQLDTNTPASFDALAEYYRSRNKLSDADLATEQADKLRRRPQ